jgi:phosphohistidine phosphatase
MKTLLLMRHAKSDWSSGATSDHARPLNDLGRRTAPLVGSFLKEHLGTPPLILSSTAERARQTAELVAETAGYSSEIVLRDILYSGQPSDYVQTVKQLNDRIDFCLLIGHNPLLEQTVSLLLSGNEHRMQVVMPTAALVCLSFDTGIWKDVAPGDGLLRWMRIPKMGED